MLCRTQPGWEGSLGENGYVCLHSWVPLLSTWNYHNIVNWLRASAQALQSCLTLSDPMECSLLYRGFSRQEHWNGLPCPPPGDLPNPGIEPRSLILQADSLPYWRGQPTPSPGDLSNLGIKLGSPTQQMDSLPAELPRKPSLNSSVPLSTIMYEILLTVQKF